MMQNYHLPKIGDHPQERCRDCAEKQRAPGYGNSIQCKLHSCFVRHSHRCDQWHKPGSLF